MDEGHYFNDYERGYVWEQSIIGLHPDSQLVILSATIGYARQFCPRAHPFRNACFFDRNCSAVACPYRLQDHEIADRTWNSETFGYGFRSFKKGAKTLA